MAKGRVAREIAPTLLELEVQVADDPDAIRSVRELGALHSGPFAGWKSWEFWADLARRWRKAAAERTPEQARDHYRRVVKALGIRRTK